ncbi:fasciclin-like arabinogalactan protein 14 [Gossypium raimondii]|uniref:FAS1 domain-containing protein n=2 Tax=Gossypium raimondii TaxID=29730 RepID=A0A0D2T2Y9_GOSRA|nr:fasciclin-like arabinogalactan protein 14 [Gossypium raimondii]KJB70013.1 hypothetical protein B456_011G053400 [Gossypium raimondii]
MSTSPVITLLFSLFFVLLSPTYAFNITEILKPYKDFNLYNYQLSSTGLASEINNLQIVTVLVVADYDLFAFRHLPGDDVRRILGFHVIFGYYDPTRLKSLRSRITLTTLYSGATLTANRESNGEVTFRSTTSSSKLDATFVRTVELQPRSIAVLQVSPYIKTSGDLPSTPPSPPPPPPPPPPQQSPTSLPTTASPPRKALAPPPTSQEKKSPTPTSSPNKSSNIATTSPPTKESNNTAPAASKTKPNSVSSGPPPEENPTTPPPKALSPRKALAPAPSDEDESPVASPPKPSSSTPSPSPAADVPAPAPDQKSSATPMASGNYLASILMISTAAWLFFPMI